MDEIDQNALSSIQKDVQSMKKIVQELHNNKNDDVAPRSQIDMIVLIETFIFILILSLIRIILTNVKMCNDIAALAPVKNAISLIIGTTILTSIIMIFIPEKIVRSAGKLTSFV